MTKPSFDQVDYGEPPPLSETLWNDLADGWMFDGRRCVVIDASGNGNHALIHCGEETENDP